METLEKFQNETTYLVIDQASNRFNFCGLAEVDEQVVADSLDGEDFDLDGALPDDVKIVLEIMGENHVEVADFTSVVRFVKNDTTYYYLIF